MGKKNLVSINDFSRDEILKIMELAAGFEADPHQQVLAGKVIASLFFEPSTRTRLSFESAINHLGGRVIGFSDTSNTSVSKGETFHDTITVISNYCDMIVMRHYIEGAARYASEISKVPVVKAKVGPKIMTFMCDASIFPQVPIKKEVKATVSGIYITSVRGIRGPLEAPEKKKGFMARLKEKAGK